MTNEKIIKYAKVADKIVNICEKVFSALFYVLLIFAIAVLVLGEKMFMDGSLTMELGFVVLIPSPEYQAVTVPAQVFTVISLVCGTVGFVVLCWLCRLIRKILVPMQEGRPFDNSVVGNLRKMAWVSLVGGGITEIFQLVQQVLFTWAWPLTEILTSPAINDVQYNFQLDMSFALPFLVLMFVSYVFEYGQQLQKEADETV